MESISKAKPAQKLPLVDREFSQPGKQDDVKHYDSQTVRNTPRHPPASTHRERSLTATSSIFASTASAIVKLVFTESSMTTTFIVERTTTLDNILDLGLQKLKKTHNIEYDKTHTKMSTELDNKALDLSTVLENLEYVQKCLAQHKSPVFKISPAKKSPLRPLQVLFQHQYSSYSASHKTPEFTTDPKKGPLSCPPATQTSALHDILFSSSKTTKTHSPEESIISESSAASSQSLGALPSLRTDSQPRLDTNNIAAPRSPYTPLTLHIPGGSFDDLLGEIATENTENPDTAIGSRSLAEKESFYSIKTDSSNGSSTISSTSSGIPSRRNTGSLNKPSPASLIKPSPLSSKASVLDSSPENTSKSMPSLTTEKGMPLKKQLSKQLSSAVIIKLLLPDGITTHVMAVQRMTVDTLLEKALLKIKVCFFSRFGSRDCTDLTFPTL
ncbi:hypothetical protein BKA69DRAFT_680725 [Paraphysoderma sedebokerense]|nr:hypothetical protein BKA69DRAFT_680725 [Paraphysoderma sedebokerense]